MTDLAPKDPNFEARVRASFGKQSFMATLGARLVRIEPGIVDIELPFRADLTQQHGFMHAGALATVADSACGYAALTLMPAGSAVLSIEFKINLMSPAKGELFVASGRVLRAGRTITVCQGEVRRSGELAGSPISVIQATMMTVVGRPELSD